MNFSHVFVESHLQCFLETFSIRLMEGLNEVMTQAKRCLKASVSAC
jgi:hypothetical protein